MKKYFIVLYFTTIYVSVFAQSSDTLHIFLSDTLTVNKGDTMTIWGAVENEGIIKLEQGSVIQFLGTSWYNFPNSLIFGNGKVIFKHDNFTQKIYGGSFPNIAIANKQNVELINSDISILDTLEFITGHIILNNNDLKLGNNLNAGEIVGFNENNYIVTNSNINDSKGFLIRKNLSQSLGEIPFPIGRKIGDYTPLTIHQNSTQKDTIAARIILDQVLSKATTGDDMSDFAVNKTWQIKSALPNSQKHINIQHNANNEGNKYIRNYQYIATHTAQAPNIFGGALSINEWDKILNPNSNSSVGTITTGSPITDAFISSRTFQSFLSNNVFLTKMTYENHAPYAADDINISFQNTPFIGDVLTNDVDFDGDSIYIKTTPLINPKYGEVTLLENGSYSYVPKQNFLGEDMFSYIVCDNATPSLCDTGFVHIYITEPNGIQDIIAVDDYISIKYNTTVNINAIENDLFPSTEPKTNPILLSATTAHGSASVTPEGLIKYQPHLNFKGRDYIYYYICRPNNECDTAKITVDIHENIVIRIDAPIAVDDAYNTLLNKPIFANVNMNDLNIVDTAFIFKNLTNTKHGVLNFKKNGYFSYLPTIDYVGTDFFIYEVCDNQFSFQNCSKATVFFVIKGANCNKSKICTPVVIQRKSKKVK